MERVVLKGSAYVPVPKKFVEGRSVGFTKRLYNTVRRRYQEEGAKRQKRIIKEFTTKRNSRDKPKPDEIKEKVFGAGSKEESLARPACEGSSRDKPNPDEDYGSKEESMAQPAEMVFDAGSKEKMPVPQEIVEYVVTVEVVQYMLGEPLRPVQADTTLGFDFNISSLIMEGIEEDAHTLRQYRIDKHTEFLANKDAKLVSRME